MNQPTEAASWVKKPKYPNWGFDEPRPELLKILIDLRPKRYQPTVPQPPQTYSGPSLSAMLKQYQQSRQREQQEQGEGQQSSRPHVPELLRKENQRPGSFNYKNIHPFGNETIEGASEKYFGGPIVDKSTLKWRQTYYTRAYGDIIGISDLNLPLPFNMSQIIKSVAVMSSPQMTQTAIWIGPRLLLSTLHLYHWIQGVPSTEECELVRKNGLIFNVESEICSQVLSNHSPKVELFQFSAEDDIGVFKLQDNYPPRSDWVNLEWLVERDEVYSFELKAGRKIGCVGYNSKVSDEDVGKIKSEAARQLQGNLQASAFSVDPINLDMVTKPQMRSFAPGTLDKADAKNDGIIFAVSSTLWKGSSGGPCILLDGLEGGRIIGLVRGYETLADPYNLVNGFPVGLKEALKKL